MKLSLKKSTIQAGVTPIENMFLDSYLPVVDEISLKVYLYLYKRIFGAYKNEITIEDVAKELNFSNVQIMNALKFWKNESIIDYKLSDDSKVESICFYNLFALYSGNVYNETEEVESFEKPLIDNNEYVKKIEDIIGLILKPHEIRAIIDHIEETGHSWSLVYRAYKYADEKGKPKSCNYVIGILRAWKRDNNIITEEDLDRLLSEKNSVKKIKYGKRLKKYVEQKDILTQAEKYEKLKTEKNSSVIDLLERY
ncbi:MAG: DnaD domain protein [Peptoniphilaceae bacterium]|uniref:DnaD domain protein n=1 Tax=Parvimonas sp. TaxID=1944660 RepID=UPI0025E6D37A|nr:DnaD domain protein [Parvimonas sp.]MCI5997646.1 DnaD domain protein [Parvimonas sp.]MDD7765338.1 DnaD domain protein [Peptoniphilaceae bacterium]MDY3051257.1 DnaD domain protein [Parvimonas sp.]